MNSHERFKRMYEHREADRIPIIDTPWAGTIRRWPDDMGYKGTTFFSPATYRELLQPYHKRAVDWAHERGIYARLHSCGNVMTFMPDILATGVDALNPLAVKAGSYR